MWRVNCIIKFVHTNKCRVRFPTERVRPYPCDLPLRFFPKRDLLWAVVLDYRRIVDMNKHSLSVLALGAVSGLQMSAQSYAVKPNVIYILCDDLGYGEVGFTGQQKIQTPELDQLAHEGMIFTDHYCGNAVSAASRCVLMTGLHPGHALVRANSPGYPDGQLPLRENTETIAKLMQRAGYVTACIGKWGLGAYSNSGNPNEQGFDHFFGYTDQTKAHEYYPPYLWRNGEKVLLNQGPEKKDYSHDLFTQEAFQFVKKNAEQPFFLYLAYTIPHIKYEVPDLAQYADKDWPENMKIHAAMTSRMSKDVGRLVALLRNLGLEENTLIIFSSDNGAHGQMGSLEFFQTSGKLRDKKRSMYEGGVRTPTFAYWPGKVPAGATTDHVSAFWDVLPTLSELTGEPIRGNTDGVSFLPTLLGQKELQKKHKYLYWEIYETKPRCAVRYDHWKGVVKDMRQGLKVELYDVDQDESEQTNLSAQYPEVVSAIQKMMEEAHTPNVYFDKSNKPLFNLKKACEDNGVPVTERRKKK